MRIAVLGSGLWGRNIVRELVALGHAPAVADPDPAARADAERLGACRVAASWEELGEAEAYFVASPASTHRAVVEALAPTGRPLFLEKPMALSLDDARAMADLAGPRLFVLHVWRYHPAIRELKRLYRDGELGDVRWIRSRRLNWTSPRRDCDPVWTLLPHDLSICFEITGELPPLSAAFAERAGDALTGMLAVLGDDRLFVAEVSSRCGEKTREVRLHGTRAVAVLTDDRPEVVLERGDVASSAAQRSVVRTSEDTALRLEVAACLEYLETGEPPVSAIDDALRIQERMHEIRAAGSGPASGDGSPT